MNRESNLLDEPQPSRQKLGGLRLRTATGYRGIGFRIAAVMFGLLPFGILELVLRAFDLPETKTLCDPFLDFSQLAPLFASDSKGVYRIPPERMRLFAPAEFNTPKPPNTKRVFSLGGSTTQGEPYGPPTAFTTWMGIHLELLDPGHSWEMINCGGLSYASYRVLPILREVLEYEPDLIVVYCGQNEFLEARELSGWKQTPPMAVQFASTLFRLRLVQMVTSILKPSSVADPDVKATRLQREVEALLDFQGGLEKYHRASLDKPSVVASFRWNLQQMVQACRSRNVPLVLVVPTANLRDCPPFKIESDPNLNIQERQKVESHWLSAQSESENVAKALESMKSILTIDPQHAGAHYFLGKQAIEDQDWESARRHLTAARDYDVCPLRATSEIQQVVREVAFEHRSPVLDADQLFESKSPHGLVGRSWLIDHVHPTIEGHQLLGEALAELLLKSSIVNQTKEDWAGAKTERYRTHLSKLGDAYFIRGQQRLEGLLLWTQGRSKKTGVDGEAER